MSKKKILFICGNIGPNSSQGVRYKNILPFLASEYELYTLSYNNFYDNNKIKKTVLHEFISEGKAEGKQSFNIKGKFVKIYKKLIRSFVFPDKYKYSIKEYEKEITDIISKNNITTVIIGMTPFSLYALAKSIKLLNKEIQVIVDLSDPFSLNGANNYAFIYIANFIEKYERNQLKYVDDVVVLNPAIKKKYEEVFNFSKIHVIEQGLKKESIRCSKIDPNVKQRQTLIYAGGLYHGFREAFELYKAIDSFKNIGLLSMYGNINKSLLPSSNTTKIEYKGQIDHEKLTQEYLNNDVLVFIDNDKGYQVPGKVLELLAMQKPVLFIYSNEKSPTLFYVKDSGFVIKVKNNVDNIIEGIIQIQNTDFSRVKSIDITQYYWGELNKKYLKIINE